MLRGGRMDDVYQANLLLAIRRDGNLYIVSVENFEGQLLNEIVFDATAWSKFLAKQKTPAMVLEYNLGEDNDEIS